MLVVTGVVLLVVAVDVVVTVVVALEVVTLLLVVVVTGLVVDVVAVVVDVVVVDDDVVVVGPLLQVHSPVWLGGMQAPGHAASPPEAVGSHASPESRVPLPQPETWMLASLTMRFATRWPTVDEPPPRRSLARGAKSRRFAVALVPIRVIGPEVFTCTPFGSPTALATERLPIRKRSRTLSVTGAVRTSVPCFSARSEQNW